MDVNISNLTHDEKFALFYGIMLGDGCLSLVNNKKKFIAITCSLDDDLPFFQEVVSPLLNEFRGKETNIKFRKDCRAIEFNFTDIKLFDSISSKGFPIGKKGPRLFMPKEFIEKNLIHYVLTGFFATDGSVILTKNPNKLYPRLEAHGIAPRLIKQIKDYLLEEGMEGKFYLCKRKNSTEFGETPKYRFQFNGKENLLLFNKKVGFANPKHKEKFMKFLKYSEKYDQNIQGVPCNKQHLIRNNVRL